MKYQTVEGHLVSEGDLVETRGGEKVFVVRLADEYIIGIKQGFRVTHAWYSSGFIHSDAEKLEPKGYHNDDLMRLWVDIKVDHIGGGDKMIDGWIKWSGGECPVSSWTRIDIKTDNLGIINDQPACNFYWHDPDIIAYRVVVSKEESTTGSLDVEGVITGEPSKHHWACPRKEEPKKHPLLRVEYKLNTKDITQNNKDDSEQIGGDHYSKRKIQPIDYIIANKMNFCEGNIIKYVTRYKEKGGQEDLKKARHYIDFLINNLEK